MAKYKLINDPSTAIDTEHASRSVPVAHEEYQDWLAQGNTPDPVDVIVETWLDKRLKSIAAGGYGSIAAQLEMIGEQGMAAYQTHIALVKATIPKV